jgi:ribosome modulation factor
MTMPSDRERSIAYRLGYLAGKDGQTRVLDCPLDNAVLRVNWGRGYAAGNVDRFPDWVHTVRDWLARVWYGNEEA